MNSPIICDASTTEHFYSHCLIKESTSTSSAKEYERFTFGDLMTLGVKADSAEGFTVYNLQWNFWVFVLLTTMASIKQYSTPTPCWSSHAKSKLTNEVPKIKWKNRAIFFTIYITQLPAAKICVRGWYKQLLKCKISTVNSTVTFSKAQTDTRSSLITPHACDNLLSLSFS